VVVQFILRVVVDSRRIPTRVCRRIRHSPSHREVSRDKVCRVVVDSLRNSRRDISWSGFRDMVGLLRQSIRDSCRVAVALTLTIRCRDKVVNRHKRASYRGNLRSRHKVDSHRSRDNCRLSRRQHHSRNDNQSFGGVVVA
jgi:hypothetical protein